MHHTLLQRPKGLLKKMQSSEYFESRPQWAPSIQSVDKIHYPMSFSSMNTPWKFNVALENRVSQKESSFPTTHFAGANCSTSRVYFNHEAPKSPKHSCMVWPLVNYHGCLETLPPWTSEIYSHQKVLPCPTAWFLSALHWISSCWIFISRGTSWRVLSLNGWRF